jgi:hypothetical protein
MASTVPLMGWSTGVGQNPTTTNPPAYAAKPSRQGNGLWDCAFRNFVSEPTYPVVSFLFQGRVR